MSDVLALARPELRSLVPYTPGAYEQDCIRLNANESPWRAPGDPTERGLNRYPPPRPWALRRRLAEHYGVSEEELLVTRGSSEAIDVLIRGFCSAGRDRLLICPPTFDMYRLYGAIQGIEIGRVPLLRSPDETRDFALDAQGVLASVNETTKLVFLCSPNNPTGTSMRGSDVESICEAVTGRALVIIDEAYREFADASSFRELQSRFDHVVLLRTLSKFISLAGVRCGAVIAAPALIEFLGTVLPPYTFPTPSIELVLQALTEESLRVSRERIALVRTERERLAAELLRLPEVKKVWPSDANFVLIETQDGARFTEAARRANILVRTFANEPTLADCVRVTIGLPEHNDLLVRAVSTAERGNG
jgi:histidinol-phosphate aminotransferase